jgi:hypothetical protein
MVVRRRDGNQKTKATPFFEWRNSSRPPTFACPACFSIIVASCARDVIQYIYVCSGSTIATRKNLARRCAAEFFKPGNNLQPAKSNYQSAI